MRQCYNWEDFTMAFNKILGSIRKADIDYHLIEDGDSIAVGLSGGKDSLLLLYALNQYKVLAKKYDNKSFQVIGIHLEMGFLDMDFTKLNQFLDEKEISYIHYPTKIYSILKLHPKNDETIDCSLCSKLKKGAMMKAAKEYGCNKVAFAHHADDAIETLFMNLIYGGRINTFEPKMHLSNANIDFIRPFIYCYEEEIKRTALEELKLPIVKSTCPNDGFTKRQDTKELLAKLYQTYPQAHQNFLKSLSNKRQVKLWNPFDKED